MTVLLVGYLLPVVVVSAALCGHVGEAWPPGVWWRALRAARGNLDGPEKGPVRLPDGRAARKRPGRSGSP